MSAKRFLIKLPCGFVTGINQKHMVVQVTENPNDAKVFVGKNAQNFIDRYADAGYGMVKEYTELVEI